MVHKIQQYGWRPDPLDQADHHYQAPRPVLATLPTSIDLRAQCPPINDQGQLGSCTSFGLGFAVQYDLIKQNIPSFVPSHLAFYYEERAIEGTIRSDAGASIRDGAKVINNKGVFPEDLWPYTIAKFTQAPPDAGYKSPQLTKSVSYQRINNLDINQLKGCLASGSPFVFGFIVYQSFESQAVAKSGIVPLPSWSDRPIGGHCVAAIGYSDNTHSFLCRNSWGANWGIAGYFWMPYAYIINGQLSSDFWSITVVGS